MQNKPIAILSVDPGAKGSWCLLVPDTLQVAFKPTKTLPMDILKWITEIEQSFRITVIMIEDVHAIFGTSAKSNFSFGYNVGEVNTLAQASGNRVDRVTPKIWQKKVGVKSTTKGKAIKKEVAELCARLYPKANIHGPKGGLLDGLSDSLMIAHFASLKY